MHRAFGCLVLSDREIVTELWPQGCGVEIVKRAKHETLLWRRPSGVVVVRGPGPATAAVFPSLKLTERFDWREPFGSLPMRVPCGMVSGLETSDQSREMGGQA